MRRDERSKLASRSGYAERWERCPSVGDDTHSREVADEMDGARGVGGGAQGVCAVMSRADRASGSVSALCELCSVGVDDLQM